MGTFTDDSGLPSLDEATLSVDALVADSTADDFGSGTFDSYEYLSRASTPSVPPGFGPPGLSHAHPPPMTREDPISKPVSKIVPTSAPFTPGRSSTFVPRAATPLSRVSVPSTPATTNSAIIPVTPVLPVETPSKSQAKPVSKQQPLAKQLSQAKQDVKALATNSGLSKAIASQSSQPALHNEDFPALDSSKAKSVATPVPTKPASMKTPSLTTPGKKTPTSSLVTAQVSLLGSKAAEKRTLAGLNISVPSKASQKSAVTADTPSKASIPASAFPPLPATAPSVQSPLARTAPKTLRLTSTPKTEIPAAGSATPSSVSSMFPPTIPPSRQPSLASVTRFDRPSTPTSEMISEDASVTSASLSRASSPPPTKIGSAPVRMTTKSMQKKQRKEIQKERERAEQEAAVATSKPDREPEIVPIMGRKIKQKKVRNINSAAGGSTPAASRPQSPGPAESMSAEDKTENSTPIPQKQESAEPDAGKITSKLIEFKGKGICLFF